MGLATIQSDGGDLKKQIGVSVIVTTYNWPKALVKVIEALALQTYPHFEVIIADDGSSEETAACIEQSEAKHDLSLYHVWQPDEGFQAAKIRNKAVARAGGDYLIFLDGDCIPLSHFIERHVSLAEEGWWVAGNRILLNRAFTERFLATSLEGTPSRFFKWLGYRCSGYCNRILPLAFLPFIPRKLSANVWQGAKTCNLGVWRSDFMAVNGFDECFSGWGYEDSDLVIRLINNGIKRKEGHFAVPVIHCWHEEHDRQRESYNYQELQRRLANSQVHAKVGISQYR